MISIQETSNDSLWPIEKLIETDFKTKVPKIKVFKLDNDLRVVLLSDETDRSSYVSISVNAGAVHQPTSLRGISHFVEHMLYRGTKRFPDTKAIQDFAEDHNLSWNGMTGGYLTEYFAEADNDDDSVEAAFTYVSEVMQNPTFPKDKEDMERDIVMGERLTYMSNPADTFYEVYSNHFFGGNHPLGGGGVIGSEEDIKQYTAKKAQDFFRQTYYPANSILLVTGGRDSNFYLKMIQKFFGDWKKGGEWIPNPDMDFKRETEIKETSEKKDYNHVNLLVSMFLPEDEVGGLFSRKSFALRVGAIVLSRRITMDIREEQGLSYKQYALSDRLGRNRNFELYAEFPKDVFMKGKEELLKYTDNLVTKPIEKKEFDRAMKKLKSTRWAKSSRSIAKKVASNLFNYGQLLSPEAHHPMINKLTLESVNEDIASLLEGKPLDIVAVGAIS